MKHNDAVTRLVEHGIKPSVQRIQIMHYLMTHFTHPTVEEVHELYYLRCLHLAVPRCTTRSECSQSTMLLR